MSTRDAILIAMPWIAYAVALAIGWATWLICERRGRRRR